MCRSDLERTLAEASLLGFELEMTQFGQWPPTILVRHQGGLHGLITRHAVINGTVWHNFDYLEDAELSTLRTAVMALFEVDG